MRACRSDGRVAGGHWGLRRGLLHWGGRAAAAAACRFFSFKWYLPLRCRIRLRLLRSWRRIQSGRESILFWRVHCSWKQFANHKKPFFLSKRTEIISYPRTAKKPRRALGHKQWVGHQCHDGRLVWLREGLQCLADQCKIGSRLCGGTCWTPEIGKCLACCPRVQSVRQPTCLKKTELDRVVSDLILCSSRDGTIQSMDMVLQQLRWEGSLIFSMKDQAEQAAATRRDRALQAQEPGWFQTEDHWYPTP